MPAALRTRAAHLGPERRRPQVLDAALEIAVADGLGAVTIGSVAARMRVTRPVVYACFSDRVDLVDALLDRESNTLTDALVTALHSSGGHRAPEDAFIAGFRALLRSAEQHSESWRLLLSGEPDPAVSERFARSRQEIRDVASAWLRPAIEHWWHTPDLERKLPVLIELFMATCESAVRSLLTEDSWSPDELGDFYGRAMERVFRDA